MLAMYSKRFRDTYHGYKATGTDERPVDIPEKEQALDFFHGLDHGKCAAFKSSMLNGWASKAFDSPEMVNKIYRAAENWVKPSSKPEGSAATCVTIEEDERQKKKRNEGMKSEKKKAAAVAAAMATGGSGASSSSDSNAKLPKDLWHIKCFRCKEKKH